MDDFDELEFKLDAYTPATIPMERLAKYLAVLAKLLGSESSVHFSGLEEGSTCALQKIDYEAVPKVMARLDTLNGTEAANDAKAAFDDLNKLCISDNATASIFKRKDGKRVGDACVVFEGKNLPKPMRFGPFTDTVVFDGELIRIGGKDKTAHAQLVDAEGVVWGGEMTKSLAAQIAQYLYSGTLRIHGNARWLREEDGQWVLQHLKITEFEHLKEESLLDVTRQLRGLKGTDWRAIENLDEYISISRGDDEVLH
jgi:hypothetical protein